MKPFNGLLLVAFLFAQSAFAAKSGYAPVNGPRLYYEIHGTARKTDHSITAKRAKTLVAIVPDFLNE